MKTPIVSFESQNIRKIWHEERWFFSIIDVVEALTDSDRPRKYWNDLKTKLSEEGSQIELSGKIGQLKLLASDGKKYLTDCADTETLLRIIQSIPSPKAEPFKTWLARVGYERMREVSNPEIALNRSRELWQKHGRSEKWIQQRMTGQETRNKLTDYWSDHGVQAGDEFAILTNIIHEEWTGINVKTHKDIK
jgi:DNA-damage-inducible protein D